MASYRLSIEAQEDLIRIYNFGAIHFGFAQADKYIDSLYECFDLIADNPFAFASVDHVRKGYRRCPCGSDSIYFRIVDNCIEIMAIIGRQDLENSF